MAGWNVDWRVDLSGGAPDRQGVCCRLSNRQTIKAGWGNAFVCCTDGCDNVELGRVVNDDFVQRLCE